MKSVVVLPSSIVHRRHIDKTVFLNTDDLASVVDCVNPPASVFHSIDHALNLIPCVEFNGFVPRMDGIDPKMILRRRANRFSV